MADALLLQQGGQLLVLGEEEILLSRGDPEELEFFGGDGVRTPRLPFDEDLKARNRVLSIGSV